MALRSLKPKVSISPELKKNQRQSVTIHRKTIIQGFTPEEELQYLVEGGEWEIVAQSTAFQRRSPEGQVQIFYKAIGNRLDHLAQTLHNLVNRGPRQRQAAMNVLQQMGRLRALRDEVLERFYSQGQVAIPDKAGVKIDFY